MKLTITKHSARLLKKIESADDKNIYFLRDGKYVYLILAPSGKNSLEEMKQNLVSYLH